MRSDTLFAQFRQVTEPVGRIARSSAHPFLKSGMLFLSFSSDERAKLVCKIPQAALVLICLPVTGFIRIQKLFYATCARRERDERKI